MEKLDEKFMVQIENNFLNEKEKEKIYKKLLNLVTNAAKPETQKKLKKIKFKLDEENNNSQTFNKISKDKELKLTFAELKALLPNMAIERPGIYLGWLGVKELPELSSTNSKDKFFSINVNKFLRCLINTILHEIDFEEKVDNTFNMYDQNGDGVINRNEFGSLLEHFNDYNSLNFDPDTVESIVDVLMERLDPDKTGVITKFNFQNFLNEFQKKPLTFNPFSRERSFSIVVPSEIINTDLEKAEKTEQADKTEIKLPPKNLSATSAYCKLNLKKIIWLIIYIILNISVSFGSFYLWFSLDFLAVPFARFNAGLIMLNASLLLFFMCENFLTYLSSSCWAKILPLEDTKFYHSICATIFLFAGIGHSLVHLTWTLPYIASFTDVNELNKIMRVKLEAVPTYIDLVFKSIPGVTGLILLTLIISMSITALQKLRQKNFELFYLIHKFYLLVLTLIGIHGMLQLVVMQTYWMFICIPGFIFAIEIVIKIKRFFTHRVKIESIKYLESGIVEVKLDKPDRFNFIPGHYVRIQIPEISCIQWHPFTIASSPEVDKLILLPTKIRFSVFLSLART